MKALKQFYYFCIKQLLATLGSFTDRQTLELLENGLRISYCKQLYQQGSDTKQSTKKAMTQQGNKSKAPGNTSKREGLSQLLTTLNELSDSSFVVAKDGKLYHRALLGLELNHIYETCEHELNFGNGK